MKTIITTLLLSFTIGKSLAQEPDKKLQNHSEWLHAIKPDYPIPYDPPTTEVVKAVLERVLSYLDTVTPMRVLNRQTGATITDFSKLDTAAIVERGVTPARMAACSLSATKRMPNSDMASSALSMGSV